ADEILPELEIEARRLIRARSDGGWIFGGDFSFPFGIQQIFGRAHLLRLDHVGVDEKKAGDARESADHVTFLRVDKPELPLLPFSAVNDLRQNEQRFKVDDAFLT